MHALTIALHLGTLAALIALRVWNIDGRISPDGQYYLNMSVGRPVPSPYARRLLVPWVSRALVWLSRGKLSPHHAMRGVAFLGLLAFVGLIYGAVGGWAGWAAAVILIMTDSLVGSWIMFPWLVDGWALTFAVGAWMCPNPWISAALLVLAALTKEAYWAIGLVACLWSGAPWWSVAPSVAVLLLLLLIRGAPPDREWLKHPFRAAQIQKRRTQFNWAVMLSSMKANPFVCAALIAGEKSGMMVFLVASVVMLQAQFAMDGARLLAPVLAFAVPLAVPLAPDWLLAVWVLSCLYWPLKSEFS